MGWHLNARGLVPLMVGWDLTFIVFAAHVLWYTHYTVGLWRQIATS